MKLWTVASLDKKEASEIQNKFGLPAIIAMLLQIRNIKTQEEIEDFLFNESEIADPFEIKDMDKAVYRIKKALDNYELICVYGDYDADGVTSTSLLYSYLQTIDANAMYYIPSRETEGYGMNKSAIDFLHEKGVKLIVTVDNGIASVDEINYANSLGIDTVVTDHHTPKEVLPNACAVVDLHQSDCKSKFKNLSGVGVAFKLIMALEGEYCDTNSLLDNYADLLCLGTIGDIVELKGENRVFVKRGLHSIMNSDRIGLNALVSNSGLADRVISAGNVSFTLVPRINAVGRLGLSKDSVNLLLTEDYDRAEEISQQLCEDNAQRQQIEKDILEIINDTIKNSPQLINDKVVVIDGEGWHQGVIGIVASRIKDAIGKPVIVISKSGDTAKASGRSVEGFPLVDAVFACSDLLGHCGGHPMAVGLSLETKNIELFRKRINEFADSFGDMPYDKLNISCKLNPEFLSVDLVSSLSYLEPFGAGNPTPIFGFYKMTLVNIVPLKNNTHLKLIFKRGNATIEAMMFFTSTDQFAYQKGDLLDLAVTLDLNEYNGDTKVSVKIKDIKPSNIESEQVLSSNRNFESFINDNSLSRAQLLDITPSREDFALLYRFLRANNGYKFSLDTLVYKLDNKLSFGKIKVILTAMSQLKLIEVSEGLKDCCIKILAVSGKVNIEDAEIIKKLGEM